MFCCVACLQAERDAGRECSAEGPSGLQGSARAERKPSGLAQQEELPEGWTAYTTESSGNRGSISQSADNAAQEVSVESVCKEVSHSHVLELQQAMSQCACG